MPPTSVSVPGFYGREEELGWLRGLWDQATGGGPNQPTGGPRMAVILAESGLGKSRLVQALYQQLTTDPRWDPPEVNYWPDAFGEQDAQKIKVNPELEDHDPAGPPRFLWLGMRWHDPIERNEKDNRCALPEARHALQSHVETAKARIGSWKAFLPRSGWLIARKVGEELLDSALDELIPFKNLVMKGVETAREMARDRRMSGLTAHDRAEKHVADAAEELQNQLREVLSGLGALPTVLWLDDAQWADAMTLRFLRGLWHEASQKKWPLLVVITHWEREWLELVARQDREENALPRYRDMPGFASLVLKPIPDQPLQEYLGGHLPGLTASQRKLLMEKAGGNFLSMVENVGFLLKTKGNFEQKDTTRPLSPAGEKTVNRWESDRAKRVEQRFHDLQEEVRRLLGWSSRMGIRFLQEVVDELARRQGEELDAERLLRSCIDPLAILAEVNPHLREFRDRAFHQVASQYFADMDSGLEEDLNEVLRERLGIWIDGAFDGKGELIPDSPLSSLGTSEKRDLLGMAMSRYPLEGDPATVEYQRRLRACLLAVQADALENLWDRVRETAKKLESVSWANLPAGCAGVGWLEDLRGQLSTAGSTQTALAVAKRVAECKRQEFIINSEGIRGVELVKALKILGDLQYTLGRLKEARYCFKEGIRIAQELPGQLGTLERLRNVSDSLGRLGDIEVAEGNLSIARTFFEEGLQIARELRGQLGTPESLRNVAVALDRLGDIEEAGGDLAGARVFFEEMLQIARELRGQHGTPESLRDVSIAMDKLGNIEKADGNLSAARALFGEGLQIARKVCGQLGTPQSLRDVSILLNKQGDIEKAEGNLAAARVFFEKMLQIARELRGQLGTPQSLQDVSIALDRMGNIEKADGNLFAARALFEEGLQIAREVCGQLGTPQSLRDVSIALGRLGDIELAEGNPTAARNIFEECLQIDRKLGNQLGTPQSLRDVSISLSRIGDIEVAEENLAPARALFAESLKINQELRRQLGTPESFRDVSVSLGRMGDIELAEGNLSAARALFEEGLRIAREVLVRIGTPESLRDVIGSLYRLTNVTQGEEQIQFAYEGLDEAKNLAELFPQFPNQVLEVMENYCAGLTKNQAD